VDIHSRKTLAASGFFAFVLRARPGETAPDQKDCPSKPGTALN
jgi:hypothetical protein